MITTRRVVISLILVGCLGLLLYSFTLVRPESTTPVIRNSAVAAVSPTMGSLVLRQSSVAITLAAGYVLDTQNGDGMSISSPGATVGIPQDQIHITPAQNQYVFLPGGATVLTQLPAGRVCAVAQFRLASEPTAVDQSFSWCFQTQ